MKASYQWITQYLEWYSGTPEEMRDALTFSGTEVEGLEIRGADHVMDLGVTSNRVDCLGHVGIAREVAAVSGARLRPPDCTAAAQGGNTAERATVEVLDADLCPRYTAQVIEGVRVGPSPAWLTERLQAVGLPCVNNVVDITNFVLMECNQPLHAFDLDRLDGRRVVVRRAHPGEKLRAINDREYDLDVDDLVITDASRPVALAGVMGGKESEVTDGSTNLLLESAFFDPVSVRRTSRRHKIFTDSSHRFERGLDRSAVLAASMRAAALILDACGGVLRSQPIDVGGPGERAEAISMRVNKVEAVCGVDVTAERIAAILEALECRVRPVVDGVLSVLPPAHRADLRREIDLVEEVIRIHGFDHVPERTSLAVRTVHALPGRVFRERVKDRLQGLGLMEVMTPNFVKEGLQGSVAFLHAGEGLRATSPVRTGEGALRRSLMPSLLEVRKLNHDAGNDDLRLFEVSNLHYAREAAGAVPHHVPALAFLIDGDLRDGRGVCEALLAHLGLEARFLPFESRFLARGAAGSVDLDGVPAGVIGHPSPEVLREHGLKLRPVFGELRLDVLRDRAPETKRLSDLPRYPVVSRDLSLVLPESVGYAALRDAVLAVAPPHLESVALFGEVYRSREIGAGRKNLVLRLLFRSRERTLRNEEVEERVRSILDAVGGALGATLRGGG